MKPTPTFHPNAPRRLVRLWQDYPAYYRIADYLNVNRATVWFALRQGREPRNAEIREKFGLPRTQRKCKTDGTKVYTPLPDYQKWWRGLDIHIRDMYIKETFDEWSSKRP